MAPAFGLFDGVIGQAGGIGADLALDHRHAGALAPDRDLFDGSGAEGVARSQDGPTALARQLDGNLAQRGGLAGSVHAHEDQHLRRGGGEVERFLQGLQDLGDDVCEGFTHFLVGDFLVKPVPGQALGDLHGGLGTQISGDQGVFQLFQRGGVELALGEDRRDAFAQLVGRAFQALRQAGEEARFFLAHPAITP